MKNILKLEEIFMFLAAILVFNTLSYSWWLFPAFLLLPDLSMLGYLANNRNGAYIYNFFHHKAVAICVFIAGYYFGIEALQLAGTILFAHASMDRVFGYGLKYITSFQDTHLGKIGKTEKAAEV